MSDLGRYLPLSQRPGGDESDVSGDWRPLIASSLTALADLASRLGDEMWARTSQDRRRTVADVVAATIRRLDASTAQLLRIKAESILGQDDSPPVPRDPVDSTVRLRALAAARLDGRGRRGIGDLMEVVLSGYDIATTSGEAIVFPSRATGAVALARLAAAPAPIRSIVGHRTLRATDAGWAIGRGAELAAPASALILFLYGRTATVPGA